MRGRRAQLAVLAALAAGLVACGGGAPTTTAPGPAPAAPVASTAPTAPPPTLPTPAPTIGPEATLSLDAGAAPVAASASDASSPLTPAKAPPGPGETWSVAITFPIAGAGPGVCPELVCPEPGAAMGAPACHTEMSPCGPRSVVSVRAEVKSSRFARSALEAPTRRLLRAFADCVARDRTKRIGGVVQAQLKFNAEGRVASGVVASAHGVESDPVVVTCMQDAMVRSPPFPASDAAGFTLTIHDDLRVGPWK